MTHAGVHPGLADYEAGLDGTPLLGHLVFYSIYQTRVTHTELADWFDELDLAEAHLPPELRDADAFERVTGPRGLKLTYPADQPDQASRRDLSAADRAKNHRIITLMVRPVQRTKEHIVRYLVREDRNEDRASLRYKTNLAAITFTHDPAGGGAGTLTVKADPKAIASLPSKEKPVVEAHLRAITDAFTDACRYYASDRLRTLVRDYLETELLAAPLRPTGGVYFVAHHRSADLADLRELVDRFGGNSQLVRVPIPDTGEMRDMVTGAVTTKITGDLDQLAADLAGATHNMVRPANRAKRIAKLNGQFQATVAAAKEAAEHLKINLEGIHDKINLVNTQFRSVLLTDPGPDDEGTDTAETDDQT